MKHYYNMTYKYCLCTKEVLNLFIKAKQLVKKQQTNTIDYYYLILIFFMDNKIFNLFLNSSFLEILFVKFKYTKLKNTSYNNINISIPLINTIQILSKKNINYTQLDLLYYILKQKYTNNNLKEIITILSKILTKFLDKNVINKNNQNIFSEIFSPIKYNSEVIIGREKEIKYIIEVLNRNLKQNIILIGSKGIGCMSIIHLLIIKLKSIKTFYCLKNKEIFLLNKNFLSNFDNTEKNKNLFIEFKNYIIKKNNIILIYPDINEIDNQNNQNNNFLDKILPLFENKNIQCIGISTTDTILKNTIIKSFFDSLEIKELSKQITFNILNLKSKYFEEYYNIVIPTKVIKDVIFFSDKYIKNEKFPQKAINLLDNICSKFVLMKKQNIFLWQNLIQKTIATQTKLPLNFIYNNKTNNYINIKYQLKKQIFGQDYAVSQVSDALKRVQVGLKTSNRPIGSWIFCGISGTGKTELAKSLANLMFGHENQLIKIDMSEYMEKHSLSKLIGSPPGYVGYGEGGQLTEKVKKNPYSVVLFDEIEKAHPDINNIMLQILEDSKITDSTGELIDFSHTLIIYTSNLGCPKDISFFKSKNKTIGFTEKHKKNLNIQIHNAIKNHFKPEFINRLDNIVIFNPLNLESLVFIANKFITKLNIKLKQNNTNLYLNINKRIRYILSKISYNPIQGARPLRRLLEKIIEKPISDILMNFKFTEPHIFSLYLKTNFNKSKICYSLEKLL